MDLSVMDCHADKSARNDRKSGFFTQDSRDCGGAVDFHRLQRILGFAMRNLCFASKHKGVTLVETCGLAKQSKIYRAKPNPPAKKQY